MIIPLCLSLRSNLRFKWTISDIHLCFIQDVYGINHFKYTLTSIKQNYDNVRLYWIDYLDILDKKNNIKKRYLKVILNNNLYNVMYNKILQDFNSFEKEILVSKNRKNILFFKFRNSYENCITNGLHDQNFVNLYDIKNDFHVSIENFEKIINDFYEFERKNRLILFSNTVTSIDKRQRFYIRNKPVIKIKIL